MRRNRLFLIFFTLVTISLVLLIWTGMAERDAHYTPEYDMVDLNPILQKDIAKLTDEDYEVLFRQTGLGKAGVDALREKDALLYLQRRYFTPVEYECTRYFLVVHSERIVKGECIVHGESKEIELTKSREEDEHLFMPAVQDGDILITFSGHFLGWRSGHAAIVIDAENGVTLEAQEMGENSQVGSLEDWRFYPCFALLRLKGATEEERAEIAVYAKDTLMGIPYALNSFCKRTEKSGEEPGVRGEMQDAPSGTQCAHLVWYAYNHFGYDIDSDGGSIVTPRDIYDSDLLEIVQVYGVHRVPSRVPPRT